MIQPALSRLGHLSVTTFGLGHMRPFPGTWGSIPPVVIAGLLIAVGDWPHGPAWWVYHLVLAVVFVLSCAACVVYGDRAAGQFGREDASEIVADETAGMCLALIALPVAPGAGPGLVLFSLVFAFVAFRIFDILKPGPIDALQRLPGGWGVLMDDLGAGAAALVVVQLVALAQ